MISWICRQFGFSVRKISEAKFRNRRDGFTSGSAFWWLGGGRIVVSTGVVSTGVSKIGRYCVQDDNQRINELVRVTAHEIFHIYAHSIGLNTRRKHGGSNEKQTRWHDRWILKKFVENRDWLLDDWGLTNDT
jgi:hypothetical protein